MNGSVVPLIEKAKHDALRLKIDALHKIFYNGDPLTSFE